MRKLFSKRGAAAADAGAVAAPGAAGAAGHSVASSLGLSRAQLMHALATYGYVSFWIVTSAGVILYNKWILTVWGFNFPITLTMWHMSFCSFVAFVLVRRPAVSSPMQQQRGSVCLFSQATPPRLQVRTGAVQDVPITRQMFTQSVLPIGARPLKLRCGRLCLRIRSYLRHQALFSRARCGLATPATPTFPCRLYRC
jgi:hypothetical protein